MAFSAVPRAGIRKAPADRSMHSTHLGLVGTKVVSTSKRSVTCAYADLDVAVVGGGPAGLATALAVLRAKPDSKVKVFESGPTYRLQGTGVGIEVNGWRALEAIDPGVVSRLMKKGLLLEGMRVYDESGKLFPMPTSAPLNHKFNLQQHGYTQVLVHWNDVRETLWQSLPEGTVEFSTKVSACMSNVDGANDGDDGHVTLQLHKRDSNGKPCADTNAVTAKVVIGSDGYFSNIRRTAVDGASPKFRDKVIWRATAQYPTREDLPDLLRNETQPMAQWWTNPMQMPNNERMFVVYPVNDGRYVWTGIAKGVCLEREGLAFTGPHQQQAKVADGGTQGEGKSGSVIKERCTAVFKDYPAVVRDIIARTTPELIIEHGMYTYDMAEMSEGVWAKGRVAMVGDAAHAAPPDGQGLNTALGDAAVLAAMLQKYGFTEEALKAYESARLPEIRGIYSDNSFQMPERTKWVYGSKFQALHPLDGEAAAT